MSSDRRIRQCSRAAASPLSPTGALGCSTYSGARLAAKGEEARPAAWRQLFPVWSFKPYRISRIFPHGSERRRVNLIGKLCLLVRVESVKTGGGGSLDFPRPKHPSSPPFPLQPRLETGTAPCYIAPIILSPITFSFYLLPLLRVCARSLCLCLSVCVSTSVCVCVRERLRDREKERERESYRLW